MQKITTFLTFNDAAEDAAKLYTSLFKNSKIVSTSHHGDGAPVPKGTVMSVTFQVDGQQFIALNGGSYFKFAEGISLYVACENQAEVDNLWEKLSEGGSKGQCGGLKDRFGVSWQIIPRALPEMLKDGDPERSKRVLSAMLQMTKIDIAWLRRAYAQK